MSKGKFFSAEDEAVYRIAADGEWIGDDDFGLSATLLDVSHDQPIAGWVLRKGAYIVTEDAQGFVDVTHYDDLASARAEMDGIEGDYDEFRADQVEN